jgi:hypothetical protein
MTDYVIVENSPTGLKKRRVKVYLEDNALEHRVKTIHLPVDTDVEAYVDGNFAALWADARSLDDDEWADAADKDDVRDKVEFVLQQIADDLALLDGALTVLEVKAVLRRTLITLRKVVRHVSD